MRAAFYAPMKPPDHPVPSGEGRMAQLFAAALERAGFAVEVASAFRSYDKTGSEGDQRRLAEEGEAEAARLVAAYRARPFAERPALWFTYHLYHKAPDHLGPTVSEALGIPYVLAEASHAPKQANGPWANGFRAAEAAIGRADRIHTINPADRACLEAVARPGALRDLAPFIDTARFAVDPAERRSRQAAVRARYGLAPSVPSIMVAAMMRDDQKLASYRVLAQGLARITDAPWSLLVAGDGPAEAEVRRLFAPLGRRVAFAGRLSGDSLAEAYAAADIYCWPSVKEAIGLAFIEAASAGAAIVAGRSGGIDAVVGNGRTGLVVPAGDALALAEALATLLADPERVRAMGAEGARQARERNDIAAAARVFAADLPPLARGQAVFDA